MTDEQNNKNKRDEHEATRVFERVTGQHTVPLRTTSTGEQMLGSTQSEEVKSVDSREQEDGKKTRKTQKAAAKKSVKPLPPWLNITLKVLRKLLIPAICIIVLYIGLYIGYVTFGKENPGDIWEFSTWKHIFDLIFADGSSS